MKFRLLKGNRSFRALWTGQLISALGDRLTQMGILTFVMVLSKDDGSKMALITFLASCRFYCSARSLARRLTGITERRL